MAASLNYRHLYYFWVVAQEKGFSRAASRLGMAVQTVSAQVRLLEAAIGAALFRPAGRTVELTAAGQVALREADRIFEIGEALPGVVRGVAEDSGSVRLNVGIADSLPKLAVAALLAPALGHPGLRLTCREGKLDDLLADLALHRLDLVLADKPVAANPDLRVQSRQLGASPLAWYATPALAARARRGFPRSLSEVPVVLPTPNAALRTSLDLWFERLDIRPRVAAEVEDSALLKTLAAAGMGAFAAAELVEADLLRRYKVRRIAPCAGAEERFYAVTAKARVPHRLVQKVLEAPAAG